MARSLTTDLVLRPLADGWLATVFGTPDLAAAADDRQECIRRLQQLINQASGDEHIDIEDASAFEPPELRDIHLRMPASDAGQIYEVPLTLRAAIRRRPADFRVFLPDLKLSFDLADLDDLSLACSQHLGERYRMDVRLDSLSAFIDSGDANPGPPLELTRVDVPVETDTSSARPEDTADVPTLEAVGEPLHRRLDRKDAPRAFERDEEVDSVAQVLTDSRERGILLVGPAGVGKTAIVQQLVGRIIDEAVPASLKGTGIWQISGGRLMAGMRYLGQWQERLLDIVDEAEQTGAVLFVDNLMELLEAAGNDEHAEGVPGLLLPHIEAGNLPFIGEVREDQLGQLEQRHPSFAQVLRQIRVDPMDTAETDAVLERVSFRLGRQHGVRLAKETRQKIIDLVGRFRGLGALPGPAVDLAERIARTYADEGVRVEGQARPVLQPSHAISGFASQTGLPQPLLDPDADFDPDTIREEFESTVLGQPEATEAMTDLMTVIRAGLNAPERPLGSYLFIGPTGVGKTQTALAVAEHLFGSEDRLLRFDMSEYQDRWSAARLVGRTRGEPGQLVRRMREQPFQVVLFDELEKADTGVFDLLLQVLGEGRLTDALGHTVSFRNSVIIMTSNLGSSGPSSLGFELGDDESVKRRRREHYRGEVESHFRPEFVGRIDRIVPFDPLGTDTAHQLVERTLEEALSREGLARRNIEVDVEPPVVDYLVDVGFDDRYGARPLQQAVENHITAALADYLARRSELTGISLRFSMVDGMPDLETV